MATTQSFDRDAKVAQLKDLRRKAKVARGESKRDQARIFRAGADRAQRQIRVFDLQVKKLAACKKKSASDAAEG